MDCKRPRISKTILQRKNKVGRHTLPDFNTYYKTVGIKAIWNWHEDRQIYQGNRIEPRDASTLYGLLICNTVTKEIQ